MVTLAAMRASGRPEDLATKGTVLEERGLTQHVQRLVLNGELDVVAPHDAKPETNDAGLLLDLREDLLRDVLGRDEARRVTGVDAGLSRCSMTPRRAPLRRRRRRPRRVRSRGRGIRPPRAGIWRKEGLGEIGIELGLVAQDLHARRPRRRRGESTREADGFHRASNVVGRGPVAPRGMRRPARFAKASKRSRSLASSIASQLVPRMPTSAPEAASKERRASRGGRG